MKSLNVVGHPDDELLFLNPDILEEIDSKVSAEDEIYVVYLTGGEDGGGILEARRRWDAIHGAYRDGDATLKFYGIHSNSFKHGDVYGDLCNLWCGKSEIRTLRDTSVLGKDRLLDTIREWIDIYKPDIIRTHDPDCEPSIDHDEPHLDHIDHIYTAKFVQEAAKSFSHIPVYAYMGYPIRYQPDNVSPDLAQKKLQMWRKYQEIDTEVAGEQWDLAASRCYKRKIQ